MAGSTHVPFKCKNTQQYFFTVPERCSHKVSVGQRFKLTWIVLRPQRVQAELTSCPLSPLCPKMCPPPVGSAGETARQIHLVHLVKIHEHFGNELCTKLVIAESFSQKFIRNCLSNLRKLPRKFKNRESTSLASSTRSSVTKDDFPWPPFMPARSSRNFQPHSLTQPSAQLAKI